MKTRFSLLLAALCGFASLVSLHAQSTAFTYQGRLNQNGAPAQGVYDLRFTIHDLPTGGSPLLNPITNSVVGVTNGLFTVPLDFGSDTFTGARRRVHAAQPAPAPHADALRVDGVERTQCTWRERQCAARGGRQPAERRLRGQ